MQIHKVNNKIKIYFKKNKKKKPFVWTGDLNVAYLSYDVYDGETNKNRSKCAGFTDYEREDFTKYFEEQNYVDVYRKFYPTERESAMTFWSYMRNNRKLNRGWRLDYFIVPKRLIDNPINVAVRSNVFGSDHAPIVMEIKLPGKLEKAKIDSKENNKKTKTKIEQKSILSFALPNSATNSIKKAKFSNSKNV